MKIRFMLAFAAVFSAIGLGFSSNLQTAESAEVVSYFGGKCAIASFQSAYSQSKVVFAGEVVGEEKRGDTRYFDFKVEKYWKGKSAKRIEIRVAETMRYQAWFKKGEKYLVYATPGTDGKLYVGRCSRSRDAGDAEEDLQKLGKGKIPR